jgi:hypothetical protein
MEKGTDWLRFLLILLREAKEVQVDVPAPRSTRLKKPFGEGRESVPVHALT